MSSNRITIISALNMFTHGIVIESLITSVPRVSLMLFPDPATLPENQERAVPLLSRYVW